MKFNKFLFSAVLISITTVNFVFSQDDLLDMLDEVVDDEPQYVAYTFKSTHIINGHSIERMQARQLDFRVNHRFGPVSGGYETFWGLDLANINLSLDYGINDWLMIGIRRGTYQRTYDGSLKFSVFRQSKGVKVMPVSISYFTDASVRAEKPASKSDELEHNFSDKLAYTHQLLIARKFNEALSLQLSPTFIHRNEVEYFEENNTVAVGVGGRYKFTRRVSFNFEYFWTDAADGKRFYAPLAIGVDIETGGHVFQLFFTNSETMAEKAVIAETQSSWLDQGWRFGFNMSRVFAIKPLFKANNH